MNRFIADEPQPPTQWWEAAGKPTPPPAEPEPPFGAEASDPDAEDLSLKLGYLYWPPGSGSP